MKKNPHIGSTLESFLKEEGVYEEAVALGLTSRKQKDIVTVREITGCFADIFPGDPCKGDFSLFGYGVTHPKPTKTK